MAPTPPRLASRTGVLARAVPTALYDLALAARDGPFALVHRRRTRPAMRIGLIGLFGLGNAGNDGSLEAMLIFLRKVRPDAELICFCAVNSGASEKVAPDFRLPTVPLAVPRPAGGLLRVLDMLSLKAPRQLASLVRSIAQARKLDLLIAPGMGMLDDFTDRPLAMPLALFGWCLAARLCGARIAFVSVGAGPITHPISRWLLKSAAAMARYRSYRDTISKNFMESIGFDTRDDAVYPDIAFKLPAPPSRPRQPRANGTLTVGVGVMAYQGWRDGDPRGETIYSAYLEKITCFVLWLLDRGHVVRILMGDAADRRAVTDVVTRVASARPDLPEGRLLAEPSCSLHELMHQIAETDVVVATRFHNVVCALKLGKPTVSIGYGEKNAALMAEMGLDRFCQHIERLQLDLLIEQFTLLLAGRQSYEQSIRETNAVYQRRLKQQDLLLAARVL